MKCLARVNSPSVVWRADSGPNGTKSFNFSKHVLNWARLSNTNKKRKSLILVNQSIILNELERTDSAGCLVRIGKAP